MSKTQSMAHPITNGYSVGMLQEIVILPERFLLNCKTSDYILSDITRFVCMSKTQSMAHRRLDTFKSSVIRQKGESQNGFFKKTKHAKFSEKQTFLTP